MKAIVCEQIEQFIYVEVEEPTVGVGEALLRIQRIGICSVLPSYRGALSLFMREYC
ncbi:hypothetical protein PAECIP111891_05998 [Paenibacillus allorhizoplanae]|uniref:Uncharacterized protein n=1 Tax=Paenibacillus allorhizoplanae TaxID=2905648 RepID=A0ABN8H859_9BACL|nr:hypothetical protein [Paenibacillus allorhizoplanae]CAH1226790.1 hypothetical protein PAECIP111891_05998 [Paenibacillus allorhizoplanae]